MKTVLIAIITILFSISAYADNEASRWGVSKQELKTFDIAWTNGTTVNNFHVKEDSSIFSMFDEIEIGYFVKNNSNKVLAISISFVGLNKDNRILWAVNSHPVMGVVGEYDAEHVTGKVKVLKGDLDKTETILMRVFNN